MIKVIMTKVIFKIDIDWRVEIEGIHSEVEISTDRIIEEDHGMSIIIKMTMGETILEKHKITENKASEVDTEIMIIEMMTLEGVEVGLKKDNIQVLLAEMIEVIVGHDEVQEPVLIKIELDVLSVENVIILKRLSEFTNRKRARKNTNV